MTNYVTYFVTSRYLLRHRSYRAQTVFASNQKLPANCSLKTSQPAREWYVRGRKLLRRDSGGRCNQQEGRNACGFVRCTGFSSFSFPPFECLWLLPCLYITLNRWEVKRCLRISLINTGVLLVEQEQKCHGMTHTKKFSLCRRNLGLLRRNLVVGLSDDVGT